MSRLVRKGRWVGYPRARTRRMFADDIHHANTTEPDDAVGYAEWLVARLGRTMERAIIRAHQRNEAQKRRLIGVYHLHTMYRRKKR